MRTHTLVAALALSLGLAACGSSTTTVQSPAASPSSAGSSSGPASSGGSASSSSGGASEGSGSTATAGAGASAGRPPRCTASHMTLLFLGQQGATGHGELGFELRNTGSAPCRTYGYPGVQFLDGSGAALPTVSTRITHDLFGSAPVVGITVGQGEGVSFRLGVSHGIASSSGCTTAAALQAIPPDDTAGIRVTIPNGAYECGTATVSPVRPGRTAYQ